MGKKGAGFIFFDDGAVKVDSICGFCVYKDFGEKTLYIYTGNDFPMRFYFKHDNDLENARNRLREALSGF